MLRKFRLTYASFRRGVADGSNQRPWIITDEHTKDKHSRKTEERLDRITRRYCSWVRQLPGEQHDEVTISEEQIKHLFSHRAQSSTSSSKTAEGLRSWARFGMAQRDQGEKAKDARALDISVHGDQHKRVQPSGPQVKQSKSLGSLRQRQMYGAWYLDPKDWNTHYKQRIKFHSHHIEDDQEAKTLQASLPGQVDMLGNTEPVSQLHATKAFRSYLEGKNDYSQPPFIKYIFKSET